VALIILDFQSTRLSFLNLVTLITCIEFSERKIRERNKKKKDRKDAIAWTGYDKNNEDHCCTQISIITNKIMHNTNGLFHHYLNTDFVIK
jgi:hypothetical protein